MNIAVVILWYLIGYAGCVWAFSREWDVTRADCVLFLFFALLGPVVPFGVFLATLDTEKVVIRRRK